MKSLKSLVFADPRPSHAQILNSRRCFLTDRPVLPTDWRRHQDFSLLKTVSYGDAMPQKKARKGISEPMDFSDLFGNHLTEKPGAPVVSVDVCAECGSGFEREHRMGRPVRFCSVECRRLHAANQRREWNAAPPPSPVTNCRRCGEPLEIREAGPGRARQYCSRRCLLRADDPPDEASDLFSLTAKPKG
ncbi:hypothetical protein AB1J06_02005 [Agrobacterium tumefaciens]|uniref:hypothetical protein n=1 Tax=Agrobacterium tumefaciens TaxID=358 RepID=UPI00345882F8